MDIYQLQAGYVFDCIKETLFKKFGKVKVDGLLKQLSYFDCILKSNVSPNQEEPNQIFLVANNIISRGLPTRPSLNIEKYLVEKHQIAKLNAKKLEEIGSIAYDITCEDTLIEKLFHALHIIEPDLSSENIRKANLQSWESHLGSEYEEDFLYNKLPKLASPFWIQLFESQREIENILRFSTNIEDEVEKYLNGSINIFNQQRVDFSLEFPYQIANQRGLIVEIDGSQHNTESQQKIDDERDNATEKAKWKRAIRFKTSEWGKLPEKLNFFKQLENEEYFKIIKSNYLQPLYKSEEGRTALELILIPIAVARIQKALINLIVSNNLNVKDKEWNIAFIERDVPCAQLAINDFILLLKNLFLLKQDSFDFPTCNLFIENIGYSRNVNSVVDRNKKYNLVIDISTLQRSKQTNIQSFPNADLILTIRSTHSPKTKRKILTSSLIAYKPLGLKDKKQNKFLEDASQVAILEKYIQDIFRKKEFRPGQVEIINRAFQNKSVIGLLPTGSGKSLTYQLGVILQAGISLVIDPIKSLMKDQYEGLLKNGIDCAVFINSSLNQKGRQLATEQIINANAMFAFVSPERLQDETFRKRLLQTNSNKNYFSYCVIDEAHCVSEWGHDFRTSYLRLGDNARKYCLTKNKVTIPFFALTATASYDVLADVQRELGIPDEDSIVRLEKLDRPELQFIIHEVVADIKPELGLSFKNKQSLGEAKQAEIHKAIKNIPNRIKEFLDDKNLMANAKESGVNVVLDEFEPSNFFSKSGDNNNAGLVFCPHRRWYFGVEDNATQIKKNIPDLKIGTFMGGNGETNRDAVNEKSQELFLNNEFDLLVATKAFGMGIDKANIRYIVHFNHPSSIESYYQEVGRAGRDRKIAVGVILFNQQAIPSNVKVQRVTEDGDITEVIEENAVSIDKDILLSFHRSNFKGIAKEKVILNELLSEIKFPTKRVLNNLEDIIVEEFGEILQLRAFSNANGRKVLYMNPNLGSIYLDRDNFPYYAGNNSINNLNSIVDFIQEYISQKCPQALSPFDWLNQFSEGITQDGIEKLLSNPTKPNEFIVQIPFENNEYERLAGLLQNDGMDITERKIKDLTEYNSDFEEFVNSLKGYSGDASRLKSHFLKIRGEQETFKAIYRLSIIGVVDDYTIDYNSKVISAQVSRKEQGYYANRLKEFLSLYNGSERVEEIMSRLPHYKGTTEIQKCLGCLIKFIYEEIAEQRNMSIRAMEEACKIGLNKNGSADFKVFVDLYMNSKYARPEYLPRDTDKGLKADFEIVKKYMDIVRKDNGGEINNLKHLRGAATILLVQRPDNFVFILLKAFSVLLIEKNDAEFIQEAQNDIIKGFSKIYDATNIDFIAFKDLLDVYENKIAEFDNEIAKRVVEIESVIFHRYHSHWLTKFNSKFIGSYERTNKRAVGVA